MPDDNRPFNSLPEDEQVQKMGEAAPHNIERPPFNPVPRLVPTKSDAELAEELKQKVADAYQPFIDLLNEYDRYGLNVQAGVGKNAFGKYQVVQLQVIKVY